MLEDEGRFYNTQNQLRILICTRLEKIVAWKVKVNFTTPQMDNPGITWEFYSTIFFKSMDRAIWDSSGKFHTSTNQNPGNHGISNLWQDSVMWGGGGLIL